jgi:hypothetical protein
VIALFSEVDLDVCVAIKKCACPDVAIALFGVIQAVRIGQVMAVTPRAFCPNGNVYCEAHEHLLLGFLKDRCVLPGADLIAIEKLASKRNVLPAIGILGHYAYCVNLFRKPFWWKLTKTTKCKSV